MKNVAFCLLLICFFTGCQNNQDWSFSSIFFGFDVEGFPITNEALAQAKKETKIAPEMIVFYMQWPEAIGSPLPITASLNAIWEAGAVPCLTWEPMINRAQGEWTIPYEDILSGQFDHYLTSMAEEVKKWEKPLIIRFAHEMNIERYHWGTSKEDFGPPSPEIYIKMVRYVVDHFHKEKTDNVFWVFCPNADSIPKKSWNAAKNYYPGDRYVDIMGMDGYNWGIDEKLAESRHLDWTSPWRSLEQTFQSLYQELKSIAPQKPMIVFETASPVRKNSQKKGTWLQDALKVAQKWGIKGIVWFQVKKEEDWKIDPNVDNSIPLFEQTSFQKWLLNHLEERRTTR